VLRIPERLRTALEFLVVLAAMSYLFLRAETGSMRAAALFRERYGAGQHLGPPIGNPYRHALTHPADVARPSRH